MYFRQVGHDYTKRINIEIQYIAKCVKIKSQTLTHESKVVVFVAESPSIQ